MNYLKWAAITTVVVVIATIVYIRTLPPSMASLTIVNRSSEVVKDGTVDLCGERARMSAVEKNEKASFNLKVYHDCSYVIDIEFQSGKRINARLGYVTHGLDNTDLVTIYDDRIELEVSKAK